MLPEISYIFFNESVDDQKLISVISNLNGFICILNPDSIVSEVQILAAYNHLGRDSDIAKRVKDRSLRLMIHIAGERQIKKAKDEVGFITGMNKAIAVYDHRPVFDKFLSEFKLAEISNQPFIPHDDRHLDRVIFPRIAMSDFQS